MKTCKAPNCPLPVFGKGYCRKHQYLREDRKQQKREAILNRKPIPKVSGKMRKSLAEYAKLRKAMLIKRPVCEIHVAVCTYHSSEVHHPKGRGAELLNLDECFATCRSCHQWVHDHVREARELGFIQSRLNKRA